MIAPPWHMLTISEEMVAGGFIVTITSNRLCHLYLRYSNVFPRIHRKSTVRRGLAMGWDARFCFTVYQHIEQNEPGDTTTHTFTWPDWENCNTRYFYFWGTVGMLDSRSDSPIFWLHYLWTALPPPVQTIFYPDPHPELTCCDGSTAYSTPSVSWAVIQPAPGRSGSAEGDNTVVRIRTTGAACNNHYGQLFRGFMLLDTSINIGCLISSASVYLWGTWKTDNQNIKPGLAIFTSWPLSNTDIVAADHVRIGADPLSNIIGYDDFIVGGLNHFTLNALGVAHLNAALAGDGIVKLGIREALFDAPNIEPLRCKRNRIADFFFHTVEKGAGFRPYLEVA